MSVAGVPDSVLEGPSFGLSFFLAIASVCFGVPVRASVAATAEVDPDGIVQPVCALRAKLTAIVDLAPSVRHVLVAVAQRAEAEDILESLGALRLGVRGIDRAWDAVPAALSASPARILRRASASPDRRRDIIDSLFALTIVGRDALLNWSPVDRTCAALRTTGSPLRWPRLTSDERWYLQFAEGVAARHEGRQKALPKWSARVIADRQAFERVSVVANYVQHASDTGRPTLVEVTRMVRRVLPDADNLHPAHAKVLGANARYAAIRGKVRQALRLQWRALDVFHGAGRHSHHEISKQCSEIYRLAGILGAWDEVRRLDGFLATTFGQSWPFDELGRSYVRLARAQVDVILGRPEAAEKELIELMKLGGAADHPRSSALRWLVRALDDLGRSGEADGYLAATPFRDDVHDALVSLDRAIRAFEWPTALKAVGQLRRIDPGPMRHLLDVAPKRAAARARFIQRLYPY